MQPLFTPEQMRGYDRRAIDEFGIPGIVLMENAAIQALNVIESEFGDVELLTVGILCGPGNNGGDGLALARQLFLRGADVEVWLFSDPNNLTGDAKQNYIAAKALDLPLIEVDSADDLEFSSYDLVVDALFGTGMARAPEGLFAEAIRTLNQMEIPVLAIDVPSGVDAETGKDLGDALDATFTVTFQCGKPGLFLPPGRDRAGEVTVVPISLPLSTEDLLSADYFVPELDDLAALFPERRRDSHKGNYGKLLIIAGSRGMGGAVRLAASAALRCGVGLCVAAVPESVRAEVARQPELMTVVLPETATGHLALAALENLKSFVEWADVIAVGPGIGQENETGKLLEKILACGKPLVIDADAINLIAAQSLTNKLPKHAILTPHPGEFARLTGSTAESQFDRIFAARNFARQHDVVLHVKGSAAVTVEPSGKAYINTSGNPGLATGGSGDILTGIIGAFLCQGIPPVAAAWGGAYMHGFAADIAADVIGEVSLLPSDVISHLPSAFAELEPES
jgi:hydroxyethylthiazole kinase-like uncharacterized protein yjeF